MDASGSKRRILTLATLPFFVGGFLGPFGTGIVISIYPELRESFDASTSAVNWAFAAYMIPMALLLLVSGTIGERLGRRRVTRFTFVAYAAASILCAVAPNLTVFILARVLQGVANAFITPLLIAGVTEVIDPARLGRAVGVYGSFQAAGGALAPFAGGVAATVDWRWGFVLVALVSLALATRPPAGEPRPAASAPPIRPLLTRRMATLWIAALSAAAGPIGASVLVGIHLRDDLDVGSSTTGIILLAAGLAAMAMSPIWGRLIDEWGAHRTSVVTALIVAVLVVPLGLAGAPWLLALGWIAAASVVGAVVVTLQHLAAIAVPDNRGGALSSVLSFRFAGHSIGPLIWVPVLTGSPGWAFAGAGSLGIVTVIALSTATRSPTT